MSVDISCLICPQTEHVAGYEVSLTCGAAALTSNLGQNFFGALGENTIWKIGPKLMRPTPREAKCERSPSAGVGDGVDGQREFFGETLVVVVVVEADGVERVGTGSGGQFQACDGAVDAIVLVTDLLDEQVGASVDDDVDVGGVGCRAEGSDEVGVFLCFTKSAALAVDGVLDVEADGSGEDQSVDQALGVFS